MVDVLAVLADLQQQLDDLTDVVAAQQRSLQLLLAVVGQPPYGQASTGRPVD